MCMSFIFHMYLCSCLWKRLKCVLTNSGQELYIHKCPQGCNKCQRLWWYKFYSNSIYRSVYTFWKPLKCAQPAPIEFALPLHIIKYCKCTWNITKLASEDFLKTRIRLQCSLSRTKIRIRCTRNRMQNHSRMRRPRSLCSDDDDGHKGVDITFLAI